VRGGEEGREGRIKSSGQVECEEVEHKAPQGVVSNPESDLENLGRGNGRWVKDIKGEEDRGDSERVRRWWVHRAGIPGMALALDVRLPLGVEAHHHSLFHLP
jgi:hypothetical protein